MQTWLVVLTLFIFWIQQSATAQGSAVVSDLNLADITSKAKPSMVYINYTYRDRVGEKSEIGSGFLVSSDGYVLTAFHVLKPWLNQSDEHKLEYPLRGWMGENFSSEIEFQEVVHSDKAQDWALVKVSAAVPMKAATVCLNHTPTGGETLAGFGFPNDAGFAPLRADFSNANDNQWTVVGNNFSRGASGGPVYNGAGEVVGLISEGILSQNITYVTPLSATEHKISEKIENQECSPQLPVVERLLNLSQSFWGAESKGCAEQIQYRWDKVEDGGYEVSRIDVQGVVWRGRVIGSNGADTLMVRDVLPASNGAREQWEFKPSLDRLVVFDKNGISTSLMRCEE